MSCSVRDGECVGGGHIRAHEHGQAAVDVPDSVVDHPARTDVEGVEIQRFTLRDGVDIRHEGDDH